MCPAGEFPILASYATKDGTFQWVVCDTSSDMHIAVAATADDVWVEIPYPPRTIRVEARTGTVLERRDSAFSEDLPTDADRIRRDPPATSTIRVRGGQDDPLVGVDAISGTEMWRVIGNPVYDDVWATDGEAVFVRAFDLDGETASASIVAYKVANGEELWKIDARGYSWPWHVAQGRLFALWFDLQVIDTTGGSVIWETSFGEPPSGYPRMFGVVTNEESVFVSFTSSAAGGD
ncbi:MAG: PQQ-binding-like beta-propeller repeat protein [Ilumatobacteraceae bacterium]